MWTKQKVRNSKAKRWTKNFVREEEDDRNNRQLYTEMPSPLGDHWLSYIHHRLKMMKRGIEVFTTDKYTRLNLDKYIESNRVCDYIAGMLVNNQPTLIHFGGAEMSPNRPISIKKHVRCPGNRKMIKSFKKRRNCVVNIVDEYYTSQTCGLCGARFDPRTKSHRFKVCHDCKPSPEMMLPSVIVTKQSKRMISLMKFLIEKELEDANGNQAAGVAAEAHPIQPDAGSLLSKVKVHIKTWLVNPVSGVLEYVDAKQPAEIEFVDWATHQPKIHKTVWDRDIVAAKCILIKGMYYLYDFHAKQYLIFYLSFIVFILF